MRICSVPLSFLKQHYIQFINCYPIKDRKNHLVLDLIAKLFWVLTLTPYITQLVMLVLKMRTLMHNWSLCNYFRQTEENKQCWLKHTWWEVASPQASWPKYGLRRWEPRHLLQIAFMTSHRLKGETPMCLKAEGENIPWGQKAEEPTMELDSAIACKSICYLVSQGKNSMRKSENERAYGTTHTHKQHWAYPIKLQSNRQQVTNRKKKPYYGRGIFFPYCNLLCRGSGRLQRNADSHCYRKRTAHTCSKTQSNRISSLNYRSSVVALSLSPSSYATVTSVFVIKAHKVLWIPIAPKKVLWIPKTQDVCISAQL